MYSRTSLAYYNVHRRNSFIVLSLYRSKSILIASFVRFRDCQLVYFTYCILLLLHSLLLTLFRVRLFNVLFDKGINARIQQVYKTSR